MPPADPALPALTAAAERGWSTVLAECGLPGPATDVRVLRHHPGSRCVLDVRTPRQRYALKAFRKDPARRAEILARLAQAGLAHPSGPSVTPLVAHSASLACLVLDWFEGPSAVELLAGGRGERVGALAAGWLQAAAGAEAAGLEHYGAAELRSDLMGWVAGIAAADAQLGGRAAAVVVGLAARPPHGHPGLLHGSFSVNHLVDLGDGPGVLDWDEPRHGPLALDAGGFLASLARHAAQRPEHAAAADAAATAFRAAFHPSADLEWFHRAALVKHAKHACRRRPPGWLALASGLLVAAGRDLV